MISIIIVNYNTSEILGKCIDSVFLFEKDVKSEIIIVDNFSDEINIKLLKDISLIHSSVKIILLDKKVSFSEANNIGYKNSSAGEYLLIMNPDIIFTEPLLNKFIGIAESKSGFGALCPFLKGVDGKFQYKYFQKEPSVCRFIFFDSVVSRLFENSERLKKRYLYDSKIQIDTNELQYVEHIPCAFFFTTSEIFAEVGMMDTSYELFFEDMDLSYKIGRKYSIAVIPFLPVLHLSGTSFKTKDNWWMYGRFIFGMINFAYKHSGINKGKKIEFTASLNSKIALLMEKVKGLFGKVDEFRIKKHRFLLELLEEKKLINK